MDDYLAARMVSWPVRPLRLRRAVRRLDRGHRLARRRGARPAAAGGAHQRRRHRDARAADAGISGKTSRRWRRATPRAQMWSRTDLKPADVDTAQLYDGFCFLTLAWIEALGFCGKGESGPFVEGGRHRARRRAAAQHLGRPALRRPPARLRLRRRGHPPAARRVRRASGAGLRGGGRRRRRRAGRRLPAADAVGAMRHGRGVLTMDRQSNCSS